MATLAVNGIELFYEDSDPQGEGGLPPLIFLHGAAGNHLSWWQQVPTFRRSYRSITVDQRGFGRSHDATGEGPARFIDDLAALVDQLQLGRVALVAQSMGGRAALGYSVRHPERVRALVMADTWGFFDWPEQVERAQALQQDVDRPLVLRALAESFQAEQPDLAFLYQQIQALNPPREGSPVAGPGAPTLPEVSACAVPTLCMVGNEDIVTPPPLIRALANELPNAEYVEVPGSGHSVYFEQPQRFNELVEGFLQRHP